MKELSTEEQVQATQMAADKGISIEAAMICVLSGAEPDSAIGIMTKAKTDVQTKQNQTDEEKEKQATIDRLTEQYKTAKTEGNGHQMIQCKNALRSLGIAIS